VIIGWVVIVGSIAAVRWTSYRASIRSEESEAERQARMRKLLDLPADGEQDRDGYWRAD
jgi:hypothetical protein